MRGRNLGGGLRRRRGHRCDGGRREFGKGPCSGEMDSCPGLVRVSQWGRPSTPRDLGSMLGDEGTLQGCPCPSGDKRLVCLTY